MNELRVDPLTGLQVDHRRGPRLAPRRRLPRRSGRPRRPREGPVPRGPRGPHAARGVGAAPRRRRARHARLARAQRAEPLPRGQRRGRGARRRTPTRTCSPPRPPPASQEVIVNAPDPVTSLADLTAEQVETAAMAWRTRMRAHSDAAFVHLLVNERREGGASLPHTHAQLYALPFVPAGRGARARALHRLRDPHDGRQPARRPAAGGGADARPHRRDRRARGAAGALRLAAAVPAHARPAPRPRPLRGRRARPAPRCCTTRCCACAAALGASPPLNLWIRTAPRGRRHVLLADRHPAAADPPRRARARRRPAPVRGRSRGRRTRASRRLTDNRCIGRAAARADEHRVDERNRLDPSGWAGLERIALSTAGVLTAAFGRVGAARRHLDDPGPARRPPGLALDQPRARAVAARRRRRRCRARLEP